MCASENEGRITYAVAINAKNGTALFALDHEGLDRKPALRRPHCQAGAVRFTGAQAFSVQLTPQSP
jgi:hypothetical protein